MTDKVTLTFYHNPADEDDRTEVIDACIELFDELKKHGFDISDLVVGSHLYKEKES